MRFEFNDDSQKICNSNDVANYGIQCDICGNKVLSVSNINGKRYCAECCYKTFIKDNQQTEIDQLKQQLAEKDKEINSLIVDYEKRISQEQELMSNMEHQLTEKDCRIEELEGQFAYECECNKQLVELQKQLEEKDKEIKKLNWQLKDKDFIIKNLNHSLSVAPNANAGQRARIDELTKIVKEKDKEIERLKERLSVFDDFKDNYGYTNYDDSEILEDLQSRAFQAEDDTRVVNELLQFFNIFDENELVDKVKEPQTQLAIQELAEVERLLYESHYKEIDGKCYAEYEDIKNLIDSRIKALEKEDA